MHAEVTFDNPATDDLHIDNAGPPLQMIRNPVGQVLLVIECAELTRHTCGMLPPPRSPFLQRHVAGDMAALEERHPKMTRVDGV